MTSQTFTSSSRCPYFSSTGVNNVKVYLCFFLNILPPFSIGPSAPSSVCRVSPYLSVRPHLPRGFVTLCRVKENSYPGVLSQEFSTLRWLSLSCISYHPFRGPCDCSSLTHFGSVGPCSSTHATRTTMYLKSGSW